jgi:predicted nucleotidyltransferase
MDIFDEDLLKFWRSLNKTDVRFLMIGGVATNLHGYHRTTNDIDLWIEDSLLNRQQLRLAFKEYGMGDFPSLETMQFVAGWTTFRLDSSLEVDIMTSVKGLEDYTFDDAYQLASIADIFDLKIPFLHINQLIVSKKAANRSKDQIDVMELEKIKKLRGEE